MSDSININYQNTTVAEGELVRPDFRGGKVFVGLLKVVNGQYTDQVPIKAFQEIGKEMSETLREGMGVKIKGRCTQRNYKDKNDDWKTDFGVVVEEYKVTAQATATTPPSSPAPGGIDDGDIPF